ncbi:MAG: cell division protein FtsZ [Verrucomicrobiota bacterium]
MIELTPRHSNASARTIKIVGIGGAGANALDRMVLDGVNPVHLIAMNTDAQALTASVAGEKVQLGHTATRGFGSGGDPELGRASAEESLNEIRSALEGIDLVFLLAGLGGGTGSGAAPVIAELAREAGALVIAVVTLPFAFEGKRRVTQAAEALAPIQQYADAVICFENDRMAETLPPKAGIQQAFVATDLTISQSVQAIAAMLARNGLIHLGFDELQAALSSVNSRCLFGYGEATGDNRPYDALARALKNPLMDKGRLLRDCEAVLVQVSGGPEMTLDEVQLLMEEFNRQIDDRTRILFGAAVDPELAGRLTVTILSSLSADEAGAVQQRATRVLPAGQPARVAPAARVVAEPERFEPISEIPEDVASVFEAEDEAAAPYEAVEPAVEFEETVPEEEGITEISERSVGVLPAAAPEKPEKPRSSAWAAQTSLFGEEPVAPPARTPREPAERIVKPVPGRMLQRPAAPKPAPATKRIEPQPVAEEPIAEPAPAPVPEKLRAPALRPPISQPAPPPAAPKTPLQETMQFEPVTRGRFEKSEPTIVDGQDLDVPTYLRRHVKIR